MIKIGSLVTLKGMKTQLYRVEKVVDHELNLLGLRAVLSGKDVGAHDIVIVPKHKLAVYRETVEAKASEAEQDTVSDDIFAEHYALALKRYTVIRNFRDQKLTREQACRELNVGRSSFYTLLKQMDLAQGLERGMQLLPYVMLSKKRAKSIRSDIPPPFPFPHRYPSSPASDMPTSDVRGVPDLPDAEVRDD